MLLADAYLPNKYKTDKVLMQMIKHINKPREQIVMPKKPKTAEEIKFYEDFKNLYDKGLCDAKIAKELDSTYSKIRYLRQQNELISNQKKKQKDKFEKAMEFYNQGLSDKKVAKNAEMSTATITKWRQRNNLPPNHEPVGGRKKND